MSDSNRFPTDFVPVSRPLVKELGYQVAYVFGVVWNYCQMEDGLCRASYETIADRADISRRSVIRHIDELIKAGYIEDLTPDIKNAPHHFCTKKGVTKLHSLEAKGSEELSPQDEKGVTKLHSRSDKIALPGVTNCHPNRKNQKTELIDDSPIGDGEPSPIPKEVKEPTVKQLESQAMFKALADLCQYDLDLIGEKERGQLNQAEKKMRENGYIPDDLKDFKAWWYAEEWRGKQGQAPNLSQVRSTWGQYKNHLNGANGRDSPPKTKFVIVPVSQEEVEEL